MLPGALRARLAPHLSARLAQTACAAAAAAQVAPAAAPAAPGTLEGLQLGSAFTEELPADPEAANSLRQVTGALFSYVDPTPTHTEPYLIAASPEVAELVGLDPRECSRPEFASVFSGNAPLPGGPRPYAACYGGHQFGMWAGQLGDGRAINLGAATGPGGASYELQLKGAGVTPYSRRADGRAVLRSSLREFVASEAHAALGIPTTRALALVGTGRGVLRDMFYNGNVREEPGAVVTRVSPCFVRFGSFQLPISRGIEMDVGLVSLLADHVIRHHYPELAGAEGNKYTALLREVARRTGHLFAAWQNVGFVHGVLNTDNCSILGETIDYGPYGYVEAFHPAFTPNTSDLPGRRHGPTLSLLNEGYAFKEQPGIGRWNVAQLATAFMAADLIKKAEAEEVIEAYTAALSEGYSQGFARKLGLQAYDRDLAVALMRLMYEDRTDFTNTFRALCEVPTGTPQGDPQGAPQEAAGEGASQPELPPRLAQVLGELAPERSAAWRGWLVQYQGHLQREGRPEDERQAGQRGVNPVYVARNSILQGAIDAAERRDFSELERVMAVLRKPYEEHPGAERYTRSEGKVRPGIEMLSCSS